MVNNRKITGIELVAPAGDMRKLDAALEYGADAVYLAGKKFGMRAASKNFDYDGLKTASLAAHSRGKRFLVTLNIFPYDSDLSEVDEYLEYLQSIHADAVIVSDLGLIKRVKSRTQIPVHVSTQANVLNSETAQIYADMGVKRIVLARELNLERIATIRSRLDPSVELEAFVHGAMCISYSGRCLLSAYLSGRSANRGECNQACRMMFKPECSPESVEMVEDDGTFIFGGNDLNMLEHLKEVRDAGINAFKIEGRVKSEYYVACVVNAYRNAIDAIAKGENVDSKFVDELKKVPNRGYNTGFYYGQPVPDTSSPQYYDFCGIVLENTQQGAVVEMRNRFKTGDKLEVLSVDSQLLNRTITIPQMTYRNGEMTDDAKIPCELYTLNGVSLPPMTMLRREHKVC